MYTYDMGNIWGRETGEAFIWLLFGLFLICFLFDYCLIIIFLLFVSFSILIWRKKKRAS